METINQFIFENKAFFAIGALIAIALLLVVLKRAYENTSELIIRDYDKIDYNDVKNNCVSAGHIHSFNEKHVVLTCGKRISRNNIINIYES